MRPVNSDFGNPSKADNSDQVAPPSVLSQMPLPEPLPRKSHARRVRSHRAAKSRLELDGSMMRSTAPASSWSPACCNTRSQVAPPSMVFQTPPLVFAEYSGPKTAAYAMSALPGSSTMRPMWWASANPACCQVAPPSSLLYTPVPAYELRELFTSPVPAQMRPVLGCTAIAPKVMVKASSNRGSKEVPWLTVRQRPPEA